MKKNKHQITVKGVSQHKVEHLLACGSGKSLHMVVHLPGTIVYFRISENIEPKGSFTDLREAVDFYNSL